MSIDVQNFKSLFPAITAHCDKNNLGDLLNIMTERRVSAGDNVITEGETTDNLYFVIDGELVSKIKDGNDHIDMGKLSKGRIFCIANLLDPGPAIMTVTATTDTTLLALSNRAFRQLENDHLQMTGNILRMLSNELVEHCRNADRMLFNRSAGINDESEHEKRTSHMDWATYVLRKLHG